MTKEPPITVERNEMYSVSEASKYLKMSEYYIKLFIDRKILKGNSVGKGNGKRYFIKGEWLVTFLAKWEAGDFHR